MPASTPSHSSQITRPKLYNGVWFYTPAEDGVDGVIVMVGQSAHLLDAALYLQLVPLLDGTLTTDEIVVQLRDEMEAEDVTSGIERLAKRRVIYDAPQGPVADLDDRKLDGLTICVQALGEQLADPVSDVLQRMGAQVSDEMAKADFGVVLTDHYLRPELEAINQSAQKPWIILGPSGHDMWVGPMFVPGETACWECLAHRLRNNRKVEQYIWLQTGAAQIPPVPSELANSFAPAAIEVACAQIAEWHANPQTPILRDQLAVLEPDKLNVAHHKVLRRPQCPSCGSTDLPDAEPIRLSPAATTGKSDADAMVTLDRYAHHVSPITGLVPALKKKTNAPGIHVYQGGRYNSHTSSNWSNLQSSLQHFGAGKGVTEAQAKASALGETLEWYTLGAPTNCKLLQESFTRLNALERALPPEKLVNFSADQMAEAERGRANGDEVSSRIPEPFNPDAVIDWRPVWSLTNQEWVYVPAGFFSWSTNTPYVPCESNGAAAGPSLEIAILHGFNELVERDAIALWWYNRVARPATVLDDLDTGFMEAMREYQHSHGRDFWLLDITTDLKIPAFVAVSIDESGDGEDGMGFGAHSDPFVAATRALTELNQLMPVSGQFVPRANRPGPGKSKAYKTTDAHVRPDPNAPPSRLDTFAYEPREDVVEDLSAAIERTRSLGLELLVADLTQPDIGMPVVKTIVPGLRHAYREFAPGRLYDVPVELGWRDVPSTEAEVSEMQPPL